MIKRLTLPKVKKFISEHLEDDPAKLVLHAKRYPDIPVKEVAFQIGARQKIKHKLPEWAAHPDVLFPSGLPLEQCSSELTARYKASVFEGKTFIDMSGGMGIDCYYFSKHFKNSFYVEKDEHLCVLAKHNFSILSENSTISVNHSVAEDFLLSFNKKADLIYVDPARRDVHNRKVFYLSDCTPDILLLKQKLLTITDKILLKTSPMLDISKAINELDNVRKVYIIAVRNECKEVLYQLGKVPVTDPAIIAVNIGKTLSDTQEYIFSKKKETQLTVQIGLPEEFIYEPNVSILKAGAFQSVACDFGLSKIHANTHLYTSEKLVADFPGRIFKCNHISKLNKKELQKLIPSGTANITARNFPVTVSDIYKKTGLKSGGDIYLFATTDQNNKHVVLVCKKV